MGSPGIRSTIWLVGYTGLIAFSATTPAGAQAPTPVGSEFQINTHTQGAQSRPSVSAHAGGFVVVWESNGSSGADTNSYSVQGRRYASSGSAQGGQFEINTYTTGSQDRPSVASSANGDFVVAWESNGSSGGDTSNASTQGQRYASDGSALGAQFQVNTYTTSNQVLPSVAMSAGGDFLAVWASIGSAGTDSSNRSIQGQRHASNGAAQGAQFQVNTFTLNSQDNPSAAALTGGGFVVVWDSLGSSFGDAFANSVQGQRYASNGSALGSEFQVNTYTTNSQSSPSVTALADGGFTVVWQSLGSAFGDTSSDSIQGQRYASDGSAQGSEFQINSYTTSQQAQPAVAGDGAGGFIAVWESLGSSFGDVDDFSIHGQRYGSDGVARGAEFQVNTYSTNAQRNSRVAVTPDGDFLVAWNSVGSSGTDSAGSSIQGQRYRIPGPPPVPAMSPATRFGLAAALLLLGAAYAQRRRS
jgi:hypothetical protein